MWWKQEFFFLLGGGDRCGGQARDLGQYYACSHTVVKEKDTPPCRQKSPAAETISAQAATSNPNQKRIVDDFI